MILEGRNSVFIITFLIIVKKLYLYNYKNSAMLLTHFAGARNCYNYLRKIIVVLTRNGVAGIIYLLFVRIVYWIFKIRYFWHATKRQVHPRIPLSAAKCRMKSLIMASKIRHDDVRKGCVEYALSRGEISEVRKRTRVDRAEPKWANHRSARSQLNEICLPGGFDPPQDAI